MLCIWDSIHPPSDVCKDIQRSISRIRRKIARGERERARQRAKAGRASGRWKGGGLGCRRRRRRWRGTRRRSMPTSGATTRGGHAGKGFPRGSITPEVATCVFRGRKKNGVKFVIDKGCTHSLLLGVVASSSSPTCPCRTVRGSLADDDEGTQD